MIKRSPRSAVIAAFSLIVLTLLMTTPVAFASDDQTEVKASPPRQQQTASAGASQTEQLQEMRRLDDRLLSTVHWSLGVVVFLAVLLAGFSWYTNFRVYERDRTNLRDELRVFLSQELENSREHLRSRFEQSQEATRSSLKEDFDKFDAQFTSANTQLSKSLRHLEEKIGERFSHARYEFLKLKIEVEELSNPVPTNHLRTYILYLQVVVEFEWSFAYVDALQKMEKLMRDGGMVSSDDLVQLNATLAKIPKDFSGVVENIRRLIPSHTSAL